MTNSIEHRGFVITVDDISLWVAFMAFIKEQQRHQFDDGLCLPPWVYRGQADSTWRITSSFERSYGVSRTEDELEAIERRSMDLFRELAQGTEATLRDAELLAHMQHYGVPTRLVDFSYAPLIALYFALNDKIGDESRPFAVWATQTNAANSWYDREARMNVACNAPNGVSSIHATEADSTEINNAARIQVEREVFERLIENDKERNAIRERIALSMYCPTTPNPRMRAQRGLFLAATKLSRPFEFSYFDWKFFEKKCFEQEERPLSEIFKNKRVAVDYIANADAFKFEFPASMRREAKSYLDLSNVRPTTLFPDFEGVAIEVKQEMLRM